MNKSNLTTLLFFSVLGFMFLTSCKGSAGKKAATETLEYIEKKAASKAASSVEREAGQAERAAEENTDNAYRSTKSSRPRHRSSNDDDDNEYEENATQAYYATCPYCNGGGFVYATDMYGNVLVDYYGNPQTTTCGNCGGSGRVIVYQ